MKTLIDLATLVDLAIQDVENRKLSYDKECIGLFQYIKEFRTIHINTGRQQGKSSYIKEHAKPWDVVITHSPDVNEYKIKNIKAYNGANINSLIDKRNYFGIPTYTRFIPRTIWIDEPTLLSSRYNMDKILSELLYDFDQKVVMLGE